MKRQWTSMQQAGMRGLGIALAAMLVNGCGEPASAALAPMLPEQATGQQPVADTRDAGSLAPARAEDLAYRDRQKSDGDIADAFGPTVWYVPPPPPPAPAPVALVQEKAPPPPKPTAPPLPFQYLGRYADGTSQVVMLVKGDQIYTVSEGETIEGNYRVEHVAAGVVELRYLPLNIKQSVPTGDAS
jgi:hypothetical protein